MRPVQFAIGPGPTLAGLSATVKPVVIIEVLRDLDSVRMMMVPRPWVLSLHVDQADVLLGACKLELEKSPVFEATYALAIHNPVHLEATTSHEKHLQEDNSCAKPDVCLQR